MPLRFEPYRSTDREACRKIILSQVGDYLAKGEEVDFERFLDGLPNPKFPFWLAYDDSTAIGCAGLKIDGETARLLWGIVAAGQLGKGYGQEMLVHRLEWIRANSPEVRSVICHTAPLTEGFFAKNGFTAYARKENYWAGKLELVAMELSLDGKLRAPSIDQAT